MTWRDRIDPELKGSFRGAEFHLLNSDAGGGRRWIIHEYPRRDVPFAEDMGLKRREWRGELVVFGDDYDLKRDALINALEAPGAATLVHPYLGTVRAVAIDPRWSESTSAGGECRFQVTFVPAEDTARQPRVTTDTRRTVTARASATQAAAESQFQEDYNVAELAADRVAAIETALRRTVAALDAAVGNVAEPAAAVIRSPVNLAGVIIGGFNRLRTTALEPIRALGLYEPLFTAGGDRAQASDDAPEQLAQQVNAQNAMTDFVQQVALCSACTASAGWTFESSDDALSSLATLSAGIDAQSLRNDPLEPALYNQLVDLRAAVVDDLRQRGANLPRLRNYIPRSTMPALLIAHQVHGDARRAPEIIRRNRIQHPGAVVGGTSLEVLSD